MIKSLIQKYNIPGPRYTSYPTVPFWDEATFTKKKWIKTFRDSFNESNKLEGISLYIHLPFCESLCTFCACHKHITKRHEVEKEYIKTVLKEWKLYVDLVDEIPVIKELHLGGGTPTILPSDLMAKLLNKVFSIFIGSKDNKKTIWLKNYGWKDPHRQITRIISDPVTI